MRRTQKSIIGKIPREDIFQFIIMLKFYKIIPSRNLRQNSFLNNSFLYNSFRYNGFYQVKNIVCSNQRNFFSTSASLTNSNTNKIIDYSPPSTLPSTLTLTDTLPENLPTNDVNFIISFNQSILEFIHNSAGLPWWATILISTIILRTFITLPIAIIQQKSGARILSLQPQIMELFEKLKHEVVREVKKRNGTYEEFQSELTNKFKAKIREIYKANKCSPIRNYLLPWVQIPLFISNSLTLRHMVDSTTKSNFNTNTSLTIPETTIVSSTSNINNIDAITSIDNMSTDTLINGGILWFNDLTLTDPTFIFPLAIGLTNLLNIEIHSWFTKYQPSIRSKILKNLSRGLSVLMIPVATQAPMAICLYWLSSSTFSVGQNLIIQLPYIQKKFGFPEKKFEISSTSKQTEKVKEALETFKKNNKTKNGSLKNKRKK
ncbi:60Kd inner membrane protein [Glomus cerebriforme]|uniref:60Kd inner membrane protein n=1 Tax=Glomus cerebriforme TaxID=658196 RepID=A0A397TR47_9GLOM|nr:60Kd inner membrane protein [Glomus cerebriforme]